MQLYTGVFTKQFLKQDPETLLLFSIVIAIFELTILYIAASADQVLLINEGIGLLQNYGLFATLIGDALLVYLIKKCFEEIRFYFNNKNIKNDPIVKSNLCELLDMIKLRTRHRYILYLFILVGVMANTSNVMFHTLGMSEIHWNAPVFDSIDHPVCFVLNRFNALYSWAIILPFCLYITICTIAFAFKILNYLEKTSLLHYDILHPDRCGGLSFVGKANVYYNFATAIVYLQITLHIVTFSVANFEHIIAYILVTICFLFGNNIFLNKINTKIDRARFEALNKCKEEVYNYNFLSFEIYKYCQDSYSSWSPNKKATYLINSTKALTVLLPLLVKIASQFII